ncbi:MBG domain-containing protein, partial [Clostridium sp. FS41]|uniref:MBG domain-containing protein n=1 Tax=Clostridium sp. FS41 TaxID=1609975 RepID=UPI0005D3A69B
EKYSITVQPGTLTVTPKEVTVTAASESFSYDGKPHSNSGYEVTGMIGTDAISAVVEGSITYPDQSPVENKVVSHTFTSGEYSNYKVEYVDGSLTMEYGEQVEITITAASESFPYDGTEHSNAKVTVTEGTLAEGDYLVAEATGTVTDVADTSTGNNPVKDGYKVMNGSVDVTEKYSITVQPGTLTVTPKDVTITADSKDYKYDGKSHSNPGYKVEGLLGGDGLRAVVEGSIKYPSQSPVENKVVNHTFTSGKESNYNVQYVNGSLTMEYGEQVEIIITAASESFPYDGTEHSNAGVTVTEGTLEMGDRLVAEAVGSVINVADTHEGNNSVREGYKVMNGDEDVTAKYKITPQNGTLSVTPKEVTITAASESFSYDGKPHSN